MFAITPIETNLLNTLDFYLKLLGGIGALVLFFIGLKRYIREQTWKKKEFVANEMKAFTSDDVARNAMLMLDWGERYVKLFPEHPQYELREVKLNREILKSALEFHERRINLEGKQRFSQTEVAIRDTFDHYLSYFERFWQFIEAGLLTHEDIRPYLYYWIDAISVKIEQDVRDVIYQYIHLYGFSGTQKLFLCFGHDIKPKSDS